MTGHNEYTIGSADQAGLEAPAPGAEKVESLAENRMTNPLGEDMLARATLLGFSTDSVERLTLDPAAVRLLSASSFAVPASLAGPVVELLVDHVPTPAEFAALERATGREVTVTITTPDLLIKARQRAASLRDVQAGRSVRSLWQRARLEGALGMTVVPGKVPSLNTPFGVVPLSDEPAVSVEEVTQWCKDTLSDHTSAVVPDGGDVWRVRYAQTTAAPVLSMTRLPSHFERAESLGLPAVSSLLTSLDSGLVLVCGPPGSGRSSAAGALAEKALVHQPRPAAILADQIERPLSSAVAPTWSCAVPDDEISLDAAVTSALSAGATVLVIDCPGDKGSLKAAAGAAAAGALVYVVVAARDALSAASMLVETVGPAAASSVMSGIVGTHLLPASGQVCPVFEVVTATLPVKASLGGNLLGLPAAVEAGGSTTGVTYELALASAVASGVLEAETARTASFDKARFDLVSGRARLYSEDADLGPDMPLLSTPVQVSPPKRRRGR